mmetsp:Transcript_16760/g.26086  ORF Transcript_16760/g.26086 Transcript_16760/m.26086 type:complete len:87 (-) Transcript_16760:270-530(-)
MKCIYRIRQQVAKGQTEEHPTRESICQGHSKFVLSELRELHGDQPGCHVQGRQAKLEQQFHRVERESGFKVPMAVGRASTMSPPNK